MWPLSFAHKLPCPLEQWMWIQLNWLKVSAGGGKHTNMNINFWFHFTQAATTKSWIFHISALLTFFFCANKIPIDRLIMKLRHRARMIKGCFVAEILLLAILCEKLLILLVHPPMVIQFNWRIAITAALFCYRVDQVSHVQ